MKPIHCLPYQKKREKGKERNEASARRRGEKTRPTSRSRTSPVRVCSDRSQRKRKKKNKRGKQAAGYHTRHAYQEMKKGRKITRRYRKDGTCPLRFASPLGNGEGGERKKKRRGKGGGVATPDSYKALQSPSISRTRTTEKKKKGREGGTEKNGLRLSLH